MLTGRGMGEGEVSTLELKVTPGSELDQQIRMWGGDAPDCGMFAYPQTNYDTPGQRTWECVRKGPTELLAQAFFLPASAPVYLLNKVAGTHIGENMGFGGLVVLPFVGIYCLWAWYRIYQAVTKG